MPRASLDSLIHLQKMAVVLFQQPIEISVHSVKKVIIWLFLTYFLCVAIHSTSSNVLAQDSESQSSEAIQSSSQSIMKTSQFRHLRKIENPFLHGNETKTTEEEPKQRRKRNNWPDSSGLGSLSSALAYLLHILAWGLLFIICAAGLYYIGLAISRYERKKVESDSPLPAAVTSHQLAPSPGETQVLVFWEQAKAAAMRGNFASAIQFLVLGALSDIEHQGQIRFRRGLTSYDYLRAVRKLPERHLALKNLVNAYEPVGFGRHEATADLYQQSLSSFEDEFLATHSTP